MRNKKLNKKPIIVGGAISGFLVTLLIVFMSPEYHCMQVSEVTKQDYIDYLYSGLDEKSKALVDSGVAYIQDSPDIPIQYIQDSAYEFCISQKPDVPPTVVLQFEDLE
ncbi:MAG: hypothetical protein K5790_10230 [Nitrosopumilus sp.]|uniref:hypothetical protein n=1 Tax=Nitrosopumilus sp. TaxID=2024843 RepID=UPI00247BDC5F|nr:hypothetical protein [Nitrosopumilus sp.]MCV0393646.1 hypothetical protein [Nitrosopumilus sp.]